MKNCLGVASIVIGTSVAIFAFLSLQKSNDAVYHQNPFGIKRSAYGTVLARLGQKNLDRAWHYGAVASAINERGGDAHAGHGHEKEEEIKEGDEHRGHDHEEGAEVSEPGLIEGVLLFLVALDAERFRRTSWLPRSEAQENAIAMDIENLLLRGYNMDPTDYGVYDTYLHFLLYHPLRGTAAARKHAYSISEYSIKMTEGQEVDPMPFLTAGIATLNQFFIQQDDYRREKKDDNINLPNEVLVRYQARMKYSMSNYFFLKKKAIEEGRWNLVPVARRVEGDERARQGMKMMEQFAAMIERGKKSVDKSKDAPLSGGSSVK